MTACQKCGVEYPSQEGYFYQRKSGVFQSPCKSCIKARSACYYAENQDRINAEKALLRQTDAAFKEKKRLSDAASYQKHKDKRRAWQAEYRSRADVAEKLSIYFKALRHRPGFADSKKQYLQAYHAQLRAHPEKVHELRAKGRAWSKANPVQARALVRNRRARQRGAPGQHTAADVSKQLAAQGNKCFWCGCEMGAAATVDHYLPLAKGGSNGAENIVMACPSCNYSKGAKLPSEFLAYRKKFRTAAPAS